MPFWAKSSSEKSRALRYAGSWYEAEPQKLSKQLGEFLSAATKQNPTLDGDILAIIAPHAGYIFSGETAAFAYQAAAKQKIKRIILLGPSHHVSFHGAGLPLAEEFQTPFGDLTVDRELADKLVTRPLFSWQKEAHQAEHSLELQLPFIRQTFGKIKIMPIIIGHINSEAEAQQIADTLKPELQNDDLIVVSSDFTHYGPRYDYTPFREGVDEGIKRLDEQAFFYLSKNDLSGFSKFQRDSGDTICGVYPCQILSALLPKSATGTLLKYSRSSQIQVDPEGNSVSYMAIAFCGPKWEAKEQNAILELARQTISYYLKEGKLASAQELGFRLTPALSRPAGVFVTLRKGHELRGCIGNILASGPLYKAVQDNAIAAAIRDPRFEPLKLSELDQIQIDINILNAPQPIYSYKEIVLGRDGIILSKHGKQAVFLPSVPGEWGWSLDETLSQLALKAGLERDAWKSGATLETFQAEEIH
ncbi:MAG: AmmeMemoRadiSam system protein B [Candidatus Obscuribacterales bacterium]|nr:AmmeMemoRadiSam system protein B [Candidatus Obscuribacterales bacterium]